MTGGASMSQVADQRSPMLRPISELLVGKQYYLLARKVYLAV
jgi:hypothetical protein